MNYKLKILSDPRLNKNFQEVKKDTFEWLEKFELLDLNNPKMVQKFDSMNLSGFVGFVYPDAKLDKLKLFDRLSICLFIFDDYIEENFENSQIVIDRMKLITNGQKWDLTDNKHINNILLAYEDWKKSFLEIVSNSKAGLIDHQKNFSLAMEDYFWGCYELSKIKFEKKSVNLNEYLKIRLSDVGVKPFACLIKIDKDFQTLNMEENNELLNLVLNLASEHSFLVNDFFSVKKDREDGTPNYINVMAREKNLSEEESLKITFDRIEELTNQFEQHSQKLKELNNPDLNIYLDALSDMLFGHIEWYSFSKRYLTQNLTEVEKLYRSKEELSELQQKPKNDSLQAKIEI